MTNYKVSPTYTYKRQVTEGIGNSRRGRKASFKQDKDLSTRRMSFPRVAFLACRPAPIEAGMAEAAAAAEPQGLSRHSLSLPPQARPGKGRPGSYSI